MSFSREPRTRHHLVVLGLCVAACLGIGTWPRESRSDPILDAVILMRARLQHPPAAPPPAAPGVPDPR